MSIQAVRGFNDIFDTETTAKIQAVEQLLIQAAQAHGYSEVRLPFLEKAELYRRSIGETSDIVNKEMYTFSDKNDDLLCLRPEGTASCIRTAIEHNVLYQHSRKWYYLSPMFRRERPQKGRYRQFYQFGMEAIGIAEPFVDIEHLLLLHNIFKTLKIGSKVRLTLNYLGGADTRARYKQALQAYYHQHKNSFSPLDLQRLEENPLRILDSKDSSLQAINKNAPVMSNFYNDSEQKALEAITQQLNAHEIAYAHNPYLVRGLDYYTGCIYEWVAPELGAQATVCGGGRYDKLANQLGSQDIAATGFSIGMERLLELVETNIPPKITVTWISLSEESLKSSLQSCHKIRQACPGISVDTNYDISKIKNALKKANKRGYTYVIISGEDEINTGKYQLKDMINNEQYSLSLEEIITHLQHKV